MAFLCLLLCFLTLSSNLQSTFSVPLQTGIHGGTNASSTEFPYIVSITYNNNHDCGGAILTENFVLSAAHCFPTGFDNSKVVAGEYNLASNEGHEQVREIQAVTIHPRYQRIKHVVGEEFKNDIAIVELKTNFNLNERARTILLPDRKQSFTGNAILCGWGSTSEGGPTPNILQKADLKIVTDQVCRKYYNGIEDEEICAKGDGESKVACGGDSGGPLVQNGIVIGVVSASGTCNFAIPTIFTEVSAYVDWINQTIC